MIPSPSFYTGISQTVFVDVRPVWKRKILRTIRAIKCVLLTLIKGAGKLFSVHAIKAQRRTEVQLHSFLISALNGGEWSTFMSGPI
jgi:hypothetical protein